MSSKDLIPILPMIVVSGFSLLLLLAIAVRRSHGTAFLLTLAGQVAAFAVIPIAMADAPQQVTPLIVVDRYSLFFSGLILGGGSAVTLFAYGYLQRRSVAKDEFYVLLLLATLGSMVLASSSHFLSLFVGLEILSVSLYIMIAYLATEKQPLEAALKYMILAGASSAFLAFGMALVYAETGTMDFARIAAGVDPALILVAGYALLVSGIAFKLALVPFHMWTPDVYQGAPAPAAAFVATVSKGAVFAVLLRCFLQTNALENRSLFLILSGLSLASMAAGNFLALMQNNLKRILAYSSIAHLGYLLVAFLANRDMAVPAAGFYLVTYFLSILAAFGVISVVSAGKDRDDAEDLEEYRGLFWRRPWLAMVLSASMFSLAGIPLTAGFIGKFYLLAAGVGSARWLLVVVLISTSAIGLFYYLRVIVALYSAAPEGQPKEHLQAISWPGHVVLAAIMILLIWYGIYPSSLMRFIQSAAL